MIGLFESDGGTKEKTRIATVKTLETARKEFKPKLDKWWKMVFDTSKRLCYERSYDTGSLYKDIHLITDGNIGGASEFFAQSNTGVNNDGLMSEEDTMNRSIVAGIGTVINPKTGKPVNYGACLTVNNYVVTPLGLINISKVKKGMKVYSNGTFQEVLNTANHSYVGNIYLIDKGFSIPVECTEDHPFLVLKKGKLVWVKAKDLKLGDYLILPRCQTDIQFKEYFLDLTEKENLLTTSEYFAYPIIKINVKYKKCVVYDLEIDNTHSFVANGCLVHNSVHDGHRSGLGGWVEGTFFMDDAITMCEPILEQYMEEIWTSIAKKWSENDGRKI